MRPGEVVEGLKEHHASPHVGAIFTEARALTHQRRQSMTQGEVEPLQHTRADRQPQLLEACGTAADTVDEGLETAFVLLFDHLPIDQIGVGFLPRLLGTSWFAGAWKGLQGMVDLDQRREVTAEAIAEKARDAQDDSGRQLDELQGTGKRPWTDKRGQDEPILRSETDPDPLPPVRAPLTALTVRAGVLGLFAPDEVPHLIELHLGDGQVPQQVGIDLGSLLCGAPQPLQDGGFRHAQDKANVRQGHFDQEHFQRHDHLVFWGPQVKEHRIARFREGLLTGATPEDTSLPTLGQIGRNRTNVASVDQPIMGTVPVGARLAPVLGFSHRPNLLSRGGVLHTDRKFGLFSFSKYYRVSTAYGSQENMQMVLKRDAEDPARRWGFVFAIART